MTFSRKIPLPESRSADSARPARLKAGGTRGASLAGPESGDVAQFTGLAPPRVNRPSKRDSSDEPSMRAVRSGSSAVSRCMAR